MTNVWKRTTKYIWFALLSLLIINAAGLFTMRWVAKQTDISERKRYLEIAELASIGISADQIQQLANIHLAKSNSSDQTIKEQFTQLQKINPAGNLYLWGRLGNQIIVLADSSNSASKRTYEEMSPELRKVFANGQAAITSKPGWISALVPISDPKTRQTVGIVMLDVPEELWRKQINFTSSIPVLIALFLSILVVVPIPLHQHSEVIQQELREQITARTESEASYQKQFSDNSAVMLLIEPDSGNIVDANQAAQRFYQYTHEELLNLTIFDINVFPKCLIRESMDLVQENGGAYFVFQHKLADGSIRDIETNVSLIQMGDRKILHSIIHDITERIKNEHELRKLSRAVEYSPVSIMIADTDANIQYVNPKFNEITGYSLDEIIGQNPRILKTGDTPHESYVELWQTITTGRVWNGVFHNRRKNGETYWEAATIAPVMDEMGKITHYLAIKEDITQRKAAEQELKDQALKAEIDNLAKGEFLANMSHELRTPMNGVIGMTRLLLETYLTPEQRQYAEIIYSSGEALLPLIQDILDFSKIEANRVELENVNFDLQEMIEGTIELLCVEAQEKGIQLDLKIDQDVPRSLCGDPERLRQVIINLIGNAIKFTSQGGVSVTVEEQSEMEEEIVLRISVEDTGVGIPQDRIPHLFNPFIQGSSSIARKYGGTGLGLAISKQLVELMNGHIHVDSVEGKGSTFSFTVVLARQSSQTAANENQNVETRPRSKERQKILTGRQALPSVSPRKKQTQQSHILFVEDNPINQKVGELTLQKLGYHVDLAANGYEALQSLQSRPYHLVLMDCQMPEMDGFTASAAIRASNPVTLNPQIPIIAMTARTLDEDRELCLAAGMNDYLSKPVDANELASKLEYWIAQSSDNNKLSERVEERSVPKEQITRHETESETQMTIFNEAELLKRLMGDRELAKTILAAFIKEMPKQIASLKQEITNRNAANARLHAHSIRGASANMGAEGLREAAYQAEMLGQKSDLEGMEIFFPNVERAFEQFEQTIQKQNGSITLQGIKQ